jgi:hypothetical protein
MREWRMPRMRAVLSLLLSLSMLYDQVHYFDAGKTVQNPNYGAVTKYQPPMSARVGMVVDF